MKPTPLLLAPLALASMAFAQPASPPSATQSWHPSQRADAASTYTYTRYTVGGKFVDSDKGSVAGSPALAVDCISPADSHQSKGKFLAASLQVGSALKIDYVEPEEIRGMSYYPKVAVQYRVDDAREKQENWSPGTDKTSAAIPKDVIKKILRAHTLTVIASDAQGSELTAQFDIPDPKTVENSCNVDER